jgi:hypothetical protein
MLLPLAGGFALEKLATKNLKKQARQIESQINNMLRSGLDADGNPLTEETNNLLFLAQQAAQQTDSNLGGTESTGVPIYEQKFYQTETGDIDIDKLLPPSVADDDQDPPTTTSTNIVTGSDLDKYAEDDEDPFEEIS